MPSGNELGEDVGGIRGKLLIQPSLESYAKTLDSFPVSESDGLEAAITLR